MKSVQQSGLPKKWTCVSATKVAKTFIPAVCPAKNHDMRISY